MKLKLLALSCCLAAAFTAQAQTTATESPENKTFKPIAGDNTTEVTVHLNQDIFLNGGKLRWRKFTKDTKAFRLSIGFNGNYEKLDEDAHRSSFGLNIAPGIEKHFAGTNRLSPYIGAELPIGFKHDKYENSEIEVKNASNSFGSNPSNFNVGLRGLAGTDFYVAPRFYVGLEVGIGFVYQSYADVTTTYKNFAQPATETKGYHNYNFSPSANGGIRVGFVF